MTYVRTCKWTCRGVTSWECASTWTLLPHPTPPQGTYKKMPKTLGRFSTRRLKHEDAPLILYVSWFMLLSGKHTKTMDNHHFSWENQLFLWSFSIANCKFTRVWLAGKSPGPTISPANIELRDSKMHFPMVFLWVFLHISPNWSMIFPWLFHDFPVIFSLSPLQLLRFFFQPHDAAPRCRWSSFEVWYLKRKVQSYIYIVYVIE